MANSGGEGDFEVFYGFHESNIVIEAPVEQFGAWEHKYDFSLGDVYVKVVEVGEWLRESIKVAFDPKVTTYVHVVVVRYGDGDSFGHGSGYWWVEGIYSCDLTAERIKKQILAKEYDKQQWLPWEGYFARLEDVTVEERNMIK